MISSVSSILTTASIASGLSLLAASPPPTGDVEWSYTVPERPAAPETRQEDWARSPIDAFLLARLEEAGLSPAPEAQRATLLRRVTFDLTGLPPTPEELGDFLADTSPAAYEKVVDRLLASPHYGERMARHWLDVVRYAETNGYERDSNKPYMWRYRDWVVDAFNRDLPYDQFVVHQLAGDELDEPTPESITATGFYRLPIWDDEPGAGALQGRYDVLADIVSTTGSAFLGMSMGCARCHDHKVDPISTKDFYSMMAFVHGLTDMSTNRILRDVMDEEQQAVFEAARSEQQRNVERLSGEVATVEGELADALAEQVRMAVLTPDLEELTYRFYRDSWNSLPDFEMLRPEDEGSLPAGRIDLAPATRESAFGFVFEGELRVPASGEYSFVLASDDGARLTIGGEVVIEHNGRRHRNERVTGRATLEAGLTPLRVEYFDIDGNPTLELWWDHVEDDMWSYRTEAPLGGPDGWLEAGYDDSSWARGRAGFGSQGTPGTEISTDWVTSDLWLRQTFEWDGASEDPVIVMHHDEGARVWINGVLALETHGYLPEYRVFELTPAGREALRDGTNQLAIHGKNTNGGQYVHARVVPRGILGAVAPRDAAFGRRPLSADAAMRRGDDLGKAMEQRGEDLLGPERVADWRRLREELERERRKQLPRIQAPAAMEKRDIPPMNVHQRGSAAALGERVEPAFPSILSDALPELPERAPRGDSSGRRRVLAEWIVRPDNPLTARVMANRLWQNVFGRGIVRTPNEFGGLGEAPTHPELLDWLANELIDSGWSMKHIVRLLVTSSAYRMSSEGSPEGLAADPANDLYWRFDMRRLSAEEMRDTILAMTGRLNTRIGGPSMFTPMPRAVLETSSTPHSVWGSSPEEETYRRSIYIKVKRSLLHPVLKSFDLADTDSTCPVRFTTTTPLQALSMLNGEFIQRHAQGFAERVAAEAAGDEERISLALRLALGRDADPAQVADLVTLLHELEAEGEVDADEALFNTCLVILNLNEFAYLD